MLSGRDFAGGIIGLAYVGSLCTSNSAYIVMVGMPRLFLIASLGFSFICSRSIDFPSLAFELFVPPFLLSA